MERWRWTGRLIRELLATPCLEHASKVWWTGGKAACKNLENIQANIGRKLVGGSSKVAGIAVRGDLGWRKLEERKEEKKLLFGWRLQTLSEDLCISCCTVESLQRKMGVIEGTEEWIGRMEKQR